VGMLLMVGSRFRRYQLLQKFQRSAFDTGSLPVKIAILTERILNMRATNIVQERNTRAKQAIKMALCRRNRVMKALFTKDFELYKWVVKQLGLRLVRFNYMALKDPSKTVNAIAVDGDKVKWMLQQRLWRHRYRPRNVKHPQTGKLVRYTRHLVKPPPANFGKPVPVRQQISKRWPYGVTPERVSGTYTVYNPTAPGRGFGQPSTSGRWTGRERRREKGGVALRLFASCVFELARHTIAMAGGGSGDNKKALHAADEAERAAKERRRVMEEKRRKLEAEKELSEEDQQLKSLLEKQVETITTGSGDVQGAIQAIGEEMRSAASSMTSVPKPLKFLRAHFVPLAAAYEAMPDSEIKKELADVLAVLSTTIPVEKSREKKHVGDEKVDEATTASVVSSEEAAPKEAEGSGAADKAEHPGVGHVKKGATLRYRLAGTNKDITKWGMEFMKTISGEISAEYQSRIADGKDVTELITLVDQIVPYNMSHSAETEAVDLLAETDGIEKLPKLVDSVTAPRVCQYLVGLAHFAANTEERRVLLNVTYQIFTEMKDLPNALIIAMRMNNFGRVRETMKAAIDIKEDRSIARQMCYIYARSSGRASGG
ncbi:26S proteasome non-ATPase regulatory subunit 2, partial [Perkinsus olseni]